MRFLVDMPLSPVLARWLAGQGHDAVHASDVGMERAPDSAIIERARQEARTIITVDLDYPRLLAAAQAATPSLILFRGGNWSDADVVARMNELLRGMDETEIEGSLLVVDRERIRRRRLPV